MVARWVPYASAGVGIVLVGVLAAVVLVPRMPAELNSSGQPTDDSATDAPALTYADPAAPPLLAAEPTGPGPIGLIDPAWVSSTATATGIPTEAVLAYGAAVIAAEGNFPECRLSWNTLAGIGYAESDHGRHGGATFEPNGHVSPKIFGVLLDGTSTERIPDSDGGEFDETAEIDRAIGPMQIIPQSWRSFPSDGNGDGVPDPHNIYDAALAAANYLCRASDFAGRDGWTAGVAAYNSATSYAGIVASAAQEYFDATA